MIIAFSGSHGCGKSTAVYQKAYKLKIQHPDKSIGVFQENVRFCPYQINEGTNEDAQLWIFTNQISTELKFLTKYDIIISDRTCVDCIAYCINAGFHETAEKMLEFSKVHIHRYKEIYFKEIDNNPYAIEDGFRSVEENFRKNVEEILKTLYKVLNINVIYI